MKCTKIEVSQIKDKTEAEIIEKNSALNIHSTLMNRKINQTQWRHSQPPEK